MISPVDVRHLEARPHIELFIKVQCLEIFVFRNSVWVSGACQLVSRSSTFPANHCYSLRLSSGFNVLDGHCMHLSQPHIKTKDTCSSTGKESTVCWQLRDTSRSSRISLNMHVRSEMTNPVRCFGDVTSSYSNI